MGKKKMMGGAMVKRIVIVLAGTGPSKAPEYFGGIRAVGGRNTVLGRESGVRFGGFWREPGSGRRGFGGNLTVEGGFLAGIRPWKATVEYFGGCQAVVGS
eukprot:TRINITY_DN4780_c1_g1_i1.p2 TRINITY_DN4780_c1_g1~~TRINITY_DN4780_c1_g1_i1.p2  ORF type:complete len:100 (-),score=11.62 TRINITY_DN4780_c1_g1_i1:132-431(-)